MHHKKEQNNEKKEPEKITDQVQGLGGIGSFEGRQNSFGIIRSIWRTFQPDSAWIKELEQNSSDIFDSGRRNDKTGMVKNMQVKTGQLTMENDFLAGVNDC